MTGKALVAFLLTLLSIQTIEAGSLEQARLLIDQGRHVEAREIAIDLTQHETAAGAACALVGRTYFEEGDFRVATEWFERAIEREPNESQHHRWLGRACAERATTASIFKKPGLASRSRKALEKAIELEPANVEARRDLIVFYLNAPKMMGGSRDRAVEQADEIRRRDAAQGHLAWATIHNNDGDLDEQAKEYRAAIDRFPQLTEAWFGLGYLQQRREDYDGAFTTFAEMQKHFPDEMGAAYQVGRNGALSGGHLIEAEKALLRYLEYTPRRDEPSLADAHWRLGLVYEHLNRRDSAIGSYEAAVRLDPKHPQARAELKRLR